MIQVLTLLKHLDESAHVSKFTQPTNVYYMTLLIKGYLRVTLPMILSNLKWKNNNLPH
jgi:hypothetical protein